MKKHKIPILTLTYLLPKACLYEWSGVEPYLTLLGALAVRRRGLRPSFLHGQLAGVWRAFVVLRALNCNTTEPVSLELVQ